MTFLKSVQLRRIASFAIDCLLIGLYCSVLLLIVIAFSFEPAISDFIGNSPVKRQLVGFFALTLPVVSYFVLFENSDWRATPGKKVLKLCVVTNKSSNAISPILLRNVLKFLPWEIAHFGVNWLLYFDARHAETPLWVWALLLAPQAIVFVYFISAVLNKEGSSMYDGLAGTRIAEERH